MNWGNGRDDDFISQRRATADCSSTRPDSRRFGKFSIAQLFDGDGRCAFDQEQMGKGGFSCIIGPANNKVFWNIVLLYFNILR